MKLLPCVSRHGQATEPDGRTPLLIGSLSPTGYLYKCGVCHAVNRITPAKFASLPFITPSDLADPKGPFRQFPQFAELVYAHFTSRPKPAFHSR